MNQANSSRDPLDIILFIISLGGIILCLVVASGIFITAAFTQLIGDSVGLHYAETTAVSIAFIGLCALPTCILSFQALLGRQSPSPRSASSSWLMAAILIPFSLTLGHLAYTRNIFPRLISPLAHILAASVPVFVVVTIAHRNGPSLSPRRIWGQFLAGLWAAPLFSLILEIIFILPVLLILVMVILNNETGQALVQSLTGPDPLSVTLDEESYMWLINEPRLILLILGYIILVVPIIEEAVKTLAIWPLLRRHQTPAAAFIGGVLGGAGYGLFEALFLTQPGSLWTSTMIARIGATLIHAFTAGIACWGLAQAAGERRWSRLGLGYFTAVGIHALWNTAAVGIVIGTLNGESLLLESSSGLLGVIFISGVIFLIVLSAVALRGLIHTPQRLLHKSDRAIAD